MAQNYISRTPHKVKGVFKEYIDDFLSRITRDADILKIGSATGRDANYIEKQGYHVYRTDITKAFIEHQKNLGKHIDVFDALTGDLKKPFDLIIATAVYESA